MIQNTCENCKYYLKNLNQCIKDICEIDAQTICENYEAK